MRSNTLLKENATARVRASAKRPSQQRAINRFEAILTEAEKLLLESGLSGFSIPVLAGRLSITRGSIYSHFPTSYAIFNELAARSLTQLESAFSQQFDKLTQLPWREAIRSVVRISVEFYSNNDAARTLILESALTDDSFRAQEITVKRLAALAREINPHMGSLMPTHPDVVMLAIDMAIACFRRSVFEQDGITTEYEEAAVFVMTSFLGHYLEQHPERIAQGPQL